MAANDQTNRDIEILNGLVSRVLDSANGYNEAAQVAKDQSLRQLFNSRTAERRQIAQQLQSEVARLGGKPEQDGSSIAAAHRTFLNLKTLVENNDKAAIEEVERGEDTIRDKFKAAIADQNLSPTGRAVVERILPTIQAGHDQMSAMKKAAE